MSCNQALPVTMALQILAAETLQRMLPITTALQTNVLKLDTL